MKSKANIKSHSLHPILIHFPIVLLTITLIVDVLSFSSNHNDLDFVRYFHLAGIVSAVIAAVPGIIDYRYTVPPDSSAKKRATKHGLMNTAMLLLFIVSYYLRLQNIDEYLLAVEIPAFILMVIAGWHGGTLVHRNLIGIDMRYANAGKWKEKYVEEETGLAEVANTDELKTDQMKLLHIKGKRIVLAKTSTSFVAFNDRCSHRGGSLAGGMMMCGTVQCPWHGSQFDVENGEVKAGPAKEKISTYPLVIKDSKIYIDLTKID